jgi:hypothetical protein
MKEKLCQKLPSLLNTNYWYSREKSFIRYKFGRQFYRLQKFFKAVSV